MFSFEEDLSELTGIERKNIWCWTLKKKQFFGLWNKYLALIT